MKEDERAEERSRKIPNPDDRDTLLGEKRGYTKVSLASSKT